MSLTDDSDSAVNLWEVIYIGYSLRYLWRVSDDWLVGPSPEDALGVVGHCKNLLDIVERLKLEHCYRKVGLGLSDLIEKLYKKLAENPDVTVGEATSRLRILIADLRMAFEREGIERVAFITMPEREIEVEELLDNPVRWFGLSFGGSLTPPQCVLDDFHEAARCFAVGFAAPAILFTLRATEGVLREYYVLVTRQQSNDKMQWGRFVVLLSDKSHNCPDPLLKLLDSLRKRRNDAMHTGERSASLWGHEAAQMIIADCREAVMGMVRDLESRQGTTVF